MPTEVSTPKQSGGGGYTFADKVSASYLLKMLAGTSPLDPATGQIESVRLEKRVDGWYLDDVVLLLRKADGQAAVVAISTKSNAQITKDGFPSDFTRAIWEQRLHIQSANFNPSTDFLALATSPLDITVKSAWNSLLTKAIDADVAQFADRLAKAGYDNEIGRAIFQSLTCPSDIDSSRTAAGAGNSLSTICASRSAMWRCGIFDSMAVVPGSIAYWRDRHAYSTHSPSTRGLRWSLSPS
jgi:hypothetical protein